MKILIIQQTAAFVGSDNLLSRGGNKTLRRKGYRFQLIEAGGRIRYLKAKLDEWLEGQRRKSTSEYGSGPNQGGD